MTTTFATHVYATVRVKVMGTNFSNNPQELAEKISDAVCGSPNQWFAPVHGSVVVDGHGQHDIEAVEFADGIYGVMVDEIDSMTGLVVKEHTFDETCAPKTDSGTDKIALREAIEALRSLPEASIGNTKVHFALMRLKSIQGNE